MAKALVIVESPAKAKTINKYLGSSYIVCSSMGHIMDLPKKEMGVEIENNFLPHYIVISKRRQTLKELKKEAKDKNQIYLAPDPDREGEAISWHLSNYLGKGKQIYRIIFNEITEKAIKDAFSHPRTIDLNKVNAQQARRILDRIVGYTLSPLLWRKVGRGLSAGRVQSVAVRLIVEREREIESFIPQEYWTIEAELEKQRSEKDKKRFIAKLEKIEGKKAKIDSKDEAEKIVEELEKEKFIVTNIEEKEKKRYPYPPFTTSKLQQEAFNKLRFSASKTMRTAQELYEGLDIGNEGSVGLITYMRTDSVRIAPEAQKEARDYILKKYGKDFLPSSYPQYKSKKTAQEAHEAIRPTSSFRDPDKIKDFLTKDQEKLYRLIWNRFIASQMVPSISLVTTIDISAGKYLFIARGYKLIFAGFSLLYIEEDKEEESILPELVKNEILNLIRLVQSQHFTKPLPRFSEGSLVKTLEEKGIGRPSTYSPIIQTIVTRDYVRREKGYFFPTELGIKVSDLLTEHFPKVLDVKFTANMEEELDEIEEGKQDWIEVLKTFYKHFSANLIKAQQNITKEVIPTKEICEICGRSMVVKWGRRGKFLSCSGFPECKNAKSFSTGIKCQEPGCDGELIEKRSKKWGKFFYGCSNYPNCKYISNKLPENRRQKTENSEQKNLTSDI